MMARQDSKFHASERLCLKILTADDFWVSYLISTCAFAYVHMHPNTNTYTHTAGTKLWGNGSPVTKEEDWLSEQDNSAKKNRQIKAHFVERAAGLAGVECELGVLRDAREP